MCNGKNLTGDVAGVAEASFDAVAVTTPANPIKSDCYHNVIFYFILHVSIFIIRKVQDMITLDIMIFGCFITINKIKTIAQTIY